MRCLACGKRQPFGLWHCHGGHLRSDPATLAHRMLPGGVAAYAWLDKPVCGAACAWLAEEPEDFLVAKYRNRRRIKLTAENPLGVCVPVIHPGETLRAVMRAPGSDEMTGMPPGGA